MARWKPRRNGYADHGSRPGYETPRKDGCGVADFGSKLNPYMGPARVLLVDDETEVAAAVGTLIRGAGFEVTWGSALAPALARAVAEPFDVVLTDLRLGGTSGFEVVRRLRVEKPGLPVVVMTGHGTTETAIEAMKLGAYDYVLKPIRTTELLPLLAAAVEAGRRHQRVSGEGESPKLESIGLVGSGPLMQALYKDIGRLAPRQVPVLIRGETGTGKELVARALWKHGPREHKPFVAVNCAALPESLLESELFGHERGSFTGAEGRRIGRFEQASGGILFLDEIGDLAPMVQVKLLRVLQEQRFQRVGGTETIAVDVLVLAATHQDLEHRRTTGLFREDLYYRLAVAVVRVPPLRGRLEDIVPLVEHFSRRHGPDLGNPRTHFLPEAYDRLRSHDWPGNVRELENVVRKVILQSQGYPVTARIVGAALEGQGLEGRAGGTEPTVKGLAAELLQQACEGGIQDARMRMLNAAAEELLRQTMDRAEGNLSLAARWLGMSRLTLRAKLRQYGLRIDPAGARMPPRRSRECRSLFQVADGSLSRRTNAFQPPRGKKHLN